jgi:ketosteroid isomerase-like protein
MAVTDAQATEVPAWLREHYALVDAGRVDDYVADFADDVELRFASLPPVRGREAVRAALAGGHDRHAMRHEFVSVWQAGATTIAEFSVTYTYPHGESRTTPVVTILEGEPGAIASIRIFLDLTVHEGAA